MPQSLVPSFVLVCLTLSSCSIGKAETLTASTILAQATQAALEIDPPAIRANPLQGIARNYLISNDVKKAEWTIQTIGELYSSQPESSSMQYGADVRSKQLSLVSLLARLAVEASRVGLSQWADEQLASAEALAHKERNSYVRYVCQLRLMQAYGQLGVLDKKTQLAKEATRSLDETFIADKNEVDHKQGLLNLAEIELDLGNTVQAQVYLANTADRVSAMSERGSKVSVLPRLAWLQGRSGNGKAARAALSEVVKLRIVNDGDEERRKFVHFKNTVDFTRTAHMLSTAGQTQHAREILKESRVMLDAIPAGEEELRSRVRQEIIMAQVALGDLNLAVQAEVNITDSGFQVDTRREIMKGFFESGRTEQAGRLAEKYDLQVSLGLLEARAGDTKKAFERLKNFQDSDDDNFLRAWAHLLVQFYGIERAWEWASHQQSAWRRAFALIGVSDCLLPIQEHHCHSADN